MKFVIQRRLLVWIVPLICISYSFALNAEDVSLDFEFFRNEVQPVFLTKRDGNMRCVDCHAGKSYSGFNIVPLSENAHFWSEAESRKNFDASKGFVIPGADPLKSRLLTHPLAVSAGGDPFHGGGKHFANTDDPEWQILKDWSQGATRRNLVADVVTRIIQTNAAGDNSHVIDPKTNRIVGIIEDVEIPHGVTGSPDTTRVYITNEKRYTLDVVDSRTLKVYRRIQLSGKPNNVAVSNDGTKVYVAIMEMPGTVDIIDTKSLARTKTLNVQGAIHNIYVTPDGLHAVAGSIHTSTINVIDTKTDELAWTLKMSAGIRPMAFDTYQDGSTRNIYVQLSGFHGFAVVDFKSRKEINRIEHPEIAGVHPHYDGLQGAPAHGLGVAPNGRSIWSTSKVYGHAYVYSLPDLKAIGHVFAGQHPEWVAFTPDSQTAYIGAAGDNATFAIDVDSLREVARIPVGQVPKRVAMVRMAVD